MFIVYRHHWLDGHESEWTPGVGDGQGGLACCVHGVAKSQTWLSDWSDLIVYRNWVFLEIIFSFLLDGWCTLICDHYENEHTHKARYFFKQFFLLNLSINECNKEFPRKLVTSIQAWGRSNFKWKWC